MEPPGPVPNPEVKHFSADGSWAIGPVRVGRRQVICPVLASAEIGLFYCVRGQGKIMRRMKSRKRWEQSHGCPMPSTSFYLEGVHDALVGTEFHLVTFFRKKRLNVMCNQWHKKRWNQKFHRFALIDFVKTRLLL